MSTTFWCPQAPVQRVPCRYCAAEGQRCDRYCRGYEDESEAPEVNLSAGHASLQLAMLGLACEGEPYGYIPANALPELIRTARRVLASEQNAGAATPGRVERGPNGATIVDLGMPEERLSSAQQRLMRLFAYAVDHGYDVHYG